MAVMPLEEAADEPRNGFRDAGAGKHVGWRTPTCPSEKAVCLLRQRVGKGAGMGRGGM